MSVCAKFQLSSWSRSGWKVCVGWWGGGEHVTTMSNSNASCFRVGLSWVALGFDNYNTIPRSASQLFKIHYPSSIWVVNVIWSIVLNGTNYWNYHIRFFKLKTKKKLCTIIQLKVLNHDLWQDILVLKFRNRLIFR